MPFSYHRIDPIKEAVTAAGFTDFRATVLHIDKAVPDMASLARGLIYGNPVVEVWTPGSSQPMLAREVVSVAGIDVRLPAIFDHLADIPPDEELGTREGPGA